MWKHILKRLAQAIPLTLGILTITFFISHLAPGDPMDMYLEQQRQRQIDPEIIELLRQKYGLDLPIHVQYVKWLGNVVKGDFGESFRHRRPVLDLIAERIPYTLQLTLLALLFSTSFGIIIGIVSAVKQYSMLDKSVTLGSLVIYSIPGFWMALMLVLLFSVNLGWLPTSQTRSMDYDFFSLGQKILDRLWHLILPVFVLGIGSAAHKARFVRNRLLEVLNEEYILSARARGLKEKMVIFRHALRNAMIPLVTILGLHLPGAAFGLCFDRVHLCLAGHGDFGCERCRRPRLSCDDGHADDLCDPDHYRKPVGGYHLCSLGPKSIV